MYTSVEGLNQTWILGTLCLSTKHSLAVSYAIDERSLAMLWCLVHPLRDTESPAGKFMQYVAIHQVVHSLHAHVRRWNDRSPPRLPMFNWVEPVAESVHQYADAAVARHISTDFIANYDPHRIATLNTLLGALGLNARNGCHDGSIASDIIVGILSRYAQQHFDLYLQRWQATAHPYRWPDDHAPLPAETTPTQILQHPAHYGIIDWGALRLSWFGKSRLVKISPTDTIRATRIPITMDLQESAASPRSSIDSDGPPFGLTELSASSDEEVWHTDMSRSRPIPWAQLRQHFYPRGLLHTLETAKSSPSGRLALSHMLGERMQRFLSPCFADVSGVLEMMETETVIMVGHAVRSYLEGRDLDIPGLSAMGSVGRLELFAPLSTFPAIEAELTSVRQGWTLWKKTEWLTKDPRACREFSYLKEGTASCTKVLFFERSVGGREMSLLVGDVMTFASYLPMASFFRCCQRRVCRLVYPQTGWMESPSAELASHYERHMFHLPFTTASVLDQEHNVSPDDLDVEVRVVAGSICGDGDEL
ncbi:hypothetical protein SISNIDRAFT_470887 [Sistotremastrum niveocremeum HHB9708]|uniref:Uncharacterized protein n=1 Tax=Sistotremastrum niveocremeum HHB9708 TaxID=1314777 RepID=A0A164NAW2_9AGAM|nr:hypothetical protein SISNIDRAFT_470887 [Sistotremastrum niveocremeum HHB9708]